jgi:hypothetical protein
MGATPEVDLELARAAFAAGRLTETEAAAGRARVAWLAAAEFGRTRITSAILLLLAVAIAIGVAAARRRRRTRAPVPAIVSSAAMGSSGGDATLRNRLARRAAAPPEPPRMATRLRPPGDTGSAGDVGES